MISPIKIILFFVATDTAEDVPTSRQKYPGFVATNFTLTNVETS